MPGRAMLAAMLRSCAWLVVVAGCWTGSPPPATRGVTVAPAVAERARVERCAQPMETMLATFATAARPQLGASAADLRLTPAEGFGDGVLVATARPGVAGIFVGCAYVRVANTVASPSAFEPLPPDALVALGWLGADRAARAVLARDYVVGVLLSGASPELAASAAFGAVAFDDNHQRVATPPFAPPAAVVAPDGSATVDVWVLSPDAAATTIEGDPVEHLRYHYAIAAGGAIAVSVSQSFAFPPAYHMP